MRLRNPELRNIGSKPSKYLKYFTCLLDFIVPDLNTQYSEGLLPRFLNTTQPGAVYRLFFVDDGHFYFFLSLYTHTEKIDVLIKKKSYDARGRF